VRSALGFLVFLALLAPSSRAQDRPRSTPREAKQSDKKNARRAAVRLGLRYLASIQKPDGSWGESRAGVVGITALCNLAFQAQGEQVGRGTYGKVVSNSLDFLMKCSLEPNRAGSAYSSVQGYPTGYIYAHGDADSRMHGHGYTTQVMVLAFGTLREADPRHDPLRTKILRAIRVIEDSQQFTGGWGYKPNPASFHEGSVTVTVVQALRLAATAGFVIDKQVHRDGLRYLHQSQKDDGSFKYALHEDRSTAALTAAALCALYGFGEYYTETTRNGLEYLKDAYHNPNSLQWIFYSHYYAAQAFYRAGGAAWTLWQREGVPHLLRMQRRSGDSAGAWDDRDWEHQDVRRHGRAYATAMSCLALSVQDGYLPLFQR